MHLASRFRPQTDSTGVGRLPRIHRPWSFIMRYYYWLSSFYSSLSSVRNSILISFAVVCLLMAVLGYLAAMMIRSAAALVVEAYDRSRMSINFARAAETDFVAMQVAFLRERFAASGERQAE